MIKLLKPVYIALLCFMVISCGNSIKFCKHSKPYVPTTATFKQKKLALVLGGGGAKGFAHVGVLEELDLAGIVPDVIIGCSAGAIVGSLYAANPNISEFKELLLTGKKSDVISVSTTGWPYGLFDKSKLEQYLKNNIKTATFSGLKIPFVATATNLQFGTLTGFSEGDLVPTIVASAAYPGAYTPVEINGQYFVDCGVTDPVPVRLAKQLGFETVIAVNIAEQLPDSAPNHVLGVLKRSMEIAYINQSKYAVEGSDVVIDFKFKGIGVFTDEYNHYLYEEGKKATKAALPKIRRALHQHKHSSTNR
jgi:NTE family protein